MRELTSRHLHKLKEIETQRFIEETMEDMEVLHITPSYPVDKSQTEAFVKAVLEDAKKYGLTTEKECYTYIMAWHIIGKEILNISWLMEILEDEEAFGEEKVEALEKAIAETMANRAKELCYEIC